MNVIVESIIFTVCFLGLIPTIFLLEKKADREAEKFVKSKGTYRRTFDLYYGLVIALCLIAFSLGVILLIRIEIFFGK